jgi:hypothetical protein
VTTSHPWARSARLGLSAAVLGAALLGAAPAAQATDITNPAEHPDPITLTIDGQTYHDGADTLPGYDDYACTPIPNVQYDFADNQIQYYDGQGELAKTAHWTEWSRLSSYETWVKQQEAGSPSSTPAPSSANATPPATSTTTPSTATTSPAATSPAAASPGPSSPASKTVSAAPKTQSSAKKTKGSVTKTQTVAPKTKDSPTKTTSSARTNRSSPGTTPSTPKETASSHAKKRGTSTASSAKHSTATNRSAAVTPTAGGASAGGTNTAPSAATASQGDGGSSSTPISASTPKFKLVSDKGVGGGVGNTRPIGVGILAAVLGVVCLAFLFGSARRRSFGRVA